MQCCTVMRTCMVTEYTYQDMTAYKLVYEDVETPVNVPAVSISRRRGSPACRTRCSFRPSRRPAPVPVPCPGPAVCPPAACATANQCIPVPAAPPMCPVNICRKVELPGMAPVNVQKPDMCKRVVQRQVPYTVTLCIPHQVCRQIPVQICCPVPCCCCMGIRLRSAATRGVRSKTVQRFTILLYGSSRFPSSANRELAAAPPTNCIMLLDG